MWSKLWKLLRTYLLPWAVEKAAEAVTDKLAEADQPKDEQAQ
jgi:hypothetical protein